MFRWLSELLFGSDYLTALNNALAESHRVDQRREAAREQEEKQKPEDAWLVRFKKKQQLEQELEDAKWILDYERKLAKLQGQIAEEIARTGVRGRIPKRLQKLQSHVHDVRSSITRD